MTAIGRAPASAAPAPAEAPRRRFGRGTPAGWIVWALVIFFFVNLAAIIGVVVVDSFAKTWFASWFPDAWTPDWYSGAWRDYDLGHVFFVTAELSAIVVAVSILVGVPAAYALARRSFPFKQLVYVLFLLPILIPPITYGIPLATLLYAVHIAPGLLGVILANLVPTVPFVVLVMIPFIEQIDPKVEAAARMCGAGTFTIFLRVLGPLLVPGILAAGILVLVRTVGMFDLTFLTADASSNTIVVALYENMFGAGIRAQQSIDAMAVMYTLSMLVLLVIALRFVNPTQLVTRVGNA